MAGEDEVIDLDRVEAAVGFVRLLGQKREVRPATGTVMELIASSEHLKETGSSTQEQIGYLNASQQACRDVCPSLTVAESKQLTIGQIQALLMMSMQRVAAVKEMVAAAEPKNGRGARRSERPRRAQS